MKEETIICDGCKTEIKFETSSYPNTTRYWHCQPVFSKLNSLVYAVYSEPDTPKDYCTDCWNKNNNK